MGNDRKKFIKDSFFAFFPQIVQRLSGLIVMVFIAKYIGTAGYGIWSQFNVTVSLVSIFICLNLGQSLVRFLAGEKSEQYLSKVFSSALIFILSSTVLFGILLFIFREPLSDFLFGGKEFTTIVILLFIFLLLQNLNAANRSFLIAQRYIKTFSLVITGAMGLIALLVAITAINTNNIVLAISSLVAVELITFFILITFILNKGVKIVKPEFSCLLPLLKFSVPLLIAFLGYWIIQSSDRYLIKYFLDISNVGIYSLSYSIGLVLTLFWGAFDTVLLPDLAALYDKEKKKELEMRFSRVLKYGVAFSIPAMVGLFVLAEPIIKILSNQEFLAGSKVLMIVTIGIFFSGIFVRFTDLLNVLKKVKVLSSMWLAMAILNIGLNFWFIPKFGIMGAAYSTLIGFLLGTIAIILYSSFYFDIIFQKNWFIKITIASALMGWLVSLIPVFSLVNLVLAILIGGLIYAGLLLLLRFYDKSELLLFKEIFSMKNKKTKEINL